MIVIANWDSKESLYSGLSEPHVTPRGFERRPRRYSPISHRNHLCRSQATYYSTDDYTMSRFNHVLPSLLAQPLLCGTSKFLAYMTLHTVPVFDLTLHSVNTPVRRVAP